MDKLKLLKKNTKKIYLTRNSDIKGGNKAERKECSALKEFKNGTPRASIFSLNSGFL